MITDIFLTCRTFTLIDDLVVLLINAIKYVFHNKNYYC